VTAQTTLALIADARCADTTLAALFDSTSVYDHLEAREYCRACPVIAACEQRRRESRDAKGMPQGTWAGRLFDSKGRLMQSIPGHSVRDFTPADAARAHSGYNAARASKVKPTEWQIVGERAYQNMRHAARKALG
jgi:hypothetical protein